MELNNQRGKGTKFAFACLAMFLLLNGLTFYPVIIQDKIALIKSGLALPILFIIEFIFIVPLYVIFFRRMDGMGKGNFSIRQFLVCFFFILFFQFSGAYIFELGKKINWMIEQQPANGTLFWGSFLLLVFIVPIYEELVFRGCLLSAFLHFFKGNIYFSSLITSILFVILHTQYTDIGALIILFLVSIILIAARIVSRGLMMPIVLHMSMNGIVLGVGVIMR